MKYKTYPKVKDSGIDWIKTIPENWNVKRLKFTTKFDLSTVDRHEYDNEEQVSICHYPQVYNNEIISLETELPQGTCTQKELEKFRLKKDDVLITKDSETQDDIGVPVYIQDDFKNAVCGYHIAQLSTDKNQILGKFLFRFIQSNIVNAYFETEANGITRFGLGKDSINNLRITLPSILEQKLISEFIENGVSITNEQILKNQKLIESLKNRKQAIIDQAVTKGLESTVTMKDSGIEWIGDIPEHWKIAKIKFFCETNPSKNEVNNLPKDLEISFLPMEKIGVDGKLKLEEKRKLNEVVNGFTYFRNGDIIVAKITPCFENGKGSLCEGLENEIGFGTTELHVLRPKKELDSIFTYWWTRSNQFFQNGEASMYGAAGQKRISIEFIKNFKISYPESILEQREIGEFLKKHIEKTDEEIRKNKKSILLLKEKQQSLINQSVTKGLDPSASMKDSGVG